MGIGDLSQCEKLSKCKVANEHRRVLAVRRFLIQIFTIMSNTFKHKLNTKYRLGLVDKVPISMKKYWNRINFDKGYFLALRAKKKEQILNNEMNNELNK